MVEDLTANTAVSFDQETWKERWYVVKDGQQDTLTADSVLEVYHPTLLQTVQ